MRHLPTMPVGHVPDFALRPDSGYKLYDADNLRCCDRVCSLAFVKFIERRERERAPASASANAFAPAMPAMYPLLFTQCAAVAPSVCV